MSTKLEPLSGDPKSKPFLVLDIESKADDTQEPGFTRPFLVGVYEGRTYTEFRNHPSLADEPWEHRAVMPGGCIDGAMRHILQKRFKGWNIYAHNAGKFDYLHILPWLMRVARSMFKFSIIPVSSSIQVLDVWKPYTDKDGREQKWNKWRFLDSIRLIPTSLDKAAKSFGLEGKLQHDLALPEDDPRWTEYLRQDCVQLYRVLKKFHHYVENVLMGEVGITAPSTAMKIFRRNHLKRSVPRTVEAHEFIRRSYCGGRVEPFVRYGEGLRYYDINSSYPAAMLKPMPVGEGQRWEGDPPDRFKRERIGFCDVSVEVPADLNIPPLPIRLGRRFIGQGIPDKLIFPTGRLRGVWEWEELQLALEVGCTIHEWHESWWFGAEPFFESFVRELYAYRDKSRPEYDPALADIAKILLNSTYGKFGMKTIRRTIYRWDDPDLPDGAEPANKDPDALIWYADEETDAPYIMPQVAARVTALGRIRLYRGAQEAERKGGTVFYCDTDSVITNVELETSTALGELKDEYPQYSGHITGTFLGPKLYLLEAGSEFESVKAKGVQLKRAKRPEEESEARRFNREQFETLSRGGQILMQRLEKVGTLARADFQRGPRMVSVPRRMLGGLGKRVDLPDGTTRPHHVLMW